MEAAIDPISRENGDWGGGLGGHHGTVDFDRFTVALLFLRPEPPQLAPDEEPNLQDAHMAYLSDLQEAGQLLAAGPVVGAAERELRGFSVFRVSPEEAARLHESDPAVQAGRLRVETYPWIVPGGIVSFGSGHLPRSMAEVDA
jgi:uncharacterized protein